MEDPTVRCSINLCGSLGPRPDELMHKVMALLAGRLQINLTRGQNQNTLQPREWKELRDAAGICSGAVRLVLATQDEVRSLITTSHGVTLELGGMSIVVEIENAFVEPKGITTSGAHAASVYAASAPASSAVPFELRVEQPDSGNGAGGETSQAPLPQEPSLAQTTVAR